MQSEIFTQSNAGLAIGGYIVLNILALLLLDHWLCNCSAGHRKSVARRVIVCFLYIAVSFLPVLALLIRDGLYKYYLERYSYVWMGFLMYFGAFLLLATILEIFVRVIAHMFRKKDDEQKQGIAGRLVSTVLVLAMIGGSVAINIYGMEHARDTVITHYDVSVNKQMKNADALRVAFISDLHLSYNSDTEMIRRMVEKLNQQKPDVVLVGGDMFSSSYASVMNIDEYKKILKGIKAKDGVYWVYGNHDVEEPLFCGFSLAAPEDAVRTKKMKRFLKKSGFKILDDKCTAVCKGEVQLVGRADKYKPVDRAEKRKTPDVLMEDLDKEKPILVLAHEAGEYGDLAAEGADILFAGHTHNGQVFPGNIIVDLIDDVVYGLKERNGMKVIVSSGVGCYGPPIRVLTDSEIVIADIRFSK